MSKDLNKQFPKLISDLHNINQFDLDKFLHCGIPFMPLDLPVPEIPKDIFNQTVSDCFSWRSQWNIMEDNYQTKDWEGSVLFGPADWKIWLDTIKKDAEHFALDEDGLCKKYRNSQSFIWRVEEHNPIRSWVNSFIQDDDINLVNVYNIPSGGYLFPHVDDNPHPHLNKIYVALKWPEGNHFHFNGFGELPITDRSAWLINNYKYSHWVYNDSEHDRLVIAIAGNLHAVKDLIYNSWKQMLGIKK